MSTPISRIMPIETVYKGYRFRSRLEARWAVFFDVLGIEFQYEKEGYEVTYNDVTYRYLPDFFLPQFSCFAEVKGERDGLAKDADRMETMLDWSSPLPHMTNSESTGKGGLILLGDIPPQCFGRVFHPIIQHCRGLCRNLIEFIPTYDNKIHTFRASDDDCAWIRSITNTDPNQGWRTGDPKLWDATAIAVPLRRAHTQICAAYTNARMARFEFGEEGR